MQSNKVFKGGASFAGGAFAVGAASYLAGAGIQGIIGAAKGKCVSSPLITVGCEQKSEISLDTTTISEIVSKTLVENVVDVQQEGVTTQELRVNLSGVNCTNININQKVDIKSTLQANITSNVASKMGNTILNELNNKIENMSKATTDILAPQSSQNAKTDIKNYVRTAVENTFNTKNLNTIKNKLIVKQTGEINIQNTVCENLNINQEMIIDIYSNAVALNLVNNLMENEQYNKVLQDALNKMIAEGLGATAITDRVMSALKVLGVIFAIAAVIGFAIFIKSGGNLTDIKEALGK
jgi:subtilase family serine protease